MALLPEMLTTAALTAESARMQHIARGRLGATAPNVLLFLAVAGVASGMRLDAVPLMLGKFALPAWLPGTLALGAVWPVYRSLHTLVYPRELERARQSLRLGLLGTLLHAPRKLPRVMEDSTYTSVERRLARLLGLRPTRSDLRGRLDLLLLRFIQGQRDLGIGGRDRIDELTAMLIAGLVLGLLWVLGLPLLESSGELWAVYLEQAIRGWPGWGIVIALYGPLVATGAGAADVHLAAKAQALAEELAALAQPSPQPGGGSGSGIV